MQIAGHDIGIVSWPLDSAGMAELGRRVGAMGLQHVQLALTPLVLLDEQPKQHELDALRSSGLRVVSGMISYPGEDYSSIASIRATGGILPDALWPQRKQITQQTALLARELGLKVITTHVGFVPPAADKAGYARFVQRVREAAQIIADCGCELLLETGQEGARELMRFFSDVGAANLGVNFDPANLISYGVGQPLEALRLLGGRIKQVHLKDAIASDHPGQTWGREVPFGQGQVNVPAFMAALRDIQYRGPLIFEREAAEQNLAADIAAGIQALRQAVSE